MIQECVNFIRNHKVAAGVLAFLRIYIGYEWFTSGIGIDTGRFDASGFIVGAIVQAGGDNQSVQGWLEVFLEHVALPGDGLFIFLVMWDEVVVVIALILGLFTNFAA